MAQGSRGPSCLFSNKVLGFSLYKIYACFFNFKIQKKRRERSTYCQMTSRLPYLYIHMTFWFIYIAVIILYAQYSLFFTYYYYIILYMFLVFSKF